MSLGTLPSNFLTTPAPHITKTTIQWYKTALPEYGAAYATVLDNVLTGPECDALVSAALAHADGKWEPALLRNGATSMHLVTEVRNNERIMWDNAEVVSRLWKRLEPHLPELAAQKLKNQADVTGNGPVKRGEVWEFAELNERMRFLQYGPGEYFRPHCDGAYERPGGKERSMFTLHLYLNERTEENPLEGGATSFHAMSMDEARDVNVEPKVGRVLIFQHRGLLHSGQEVDKGLKLTMRTDLMFRKTQEQVPEEERPQIGRSVASRWQYASRGR